MKNQELSVERDLIEAETLLQQFKSDWDRGDLVCRKELLNASVESIWATQGTIQAIRLQARFTYLARHATNVEVDAEGFLMTQVAKRK